MKVGVASRCCLNISNVCLIASFQMLRSRCNTHPRCRVSARRQVAQEWRTGGIHQVAITLITNVMILITNVINPITNVINPITNVINPITIVIKMITNVMKMITNVMKMITNVILRARVIIINNIILLL